MRLFPALFVLAACSDGAASDTDGTHGEGPHTHDTEEPTEPLVREAASSAGTWLVSYAPTPDPIPLNDYFDVVVTVMANDGTSAPDPTAELAVDATMPAHGHGMNVEPSTVANGDGTFIASGLLFHMEGSWELALEITGAAGTETVAFDVACCD